MKINKKRKDYNDTDILILWLTGRPVKIYGIVDRNKIYQWPELFWEFSPVGNYNVLRLGLTESPNVIYRTIQRLVFGVKYRINYE